MSWPKGEKTLEEIEYLKGTSYDKLSPMEKLAWVHYQLGQYETPNENNTRINHGDAAIEKAYKDLEQLFEKMWYVVKEDPKMLAAHKCFDRINEKRRSIGKFRNVVHKFKKQEEWKRKQAAKKRY